MELTGTPGSGKSTILPLIVRYYQKKGYKVYDRHSLVFRYSQLPAGKIQSIALLKYFPLFFRKIFLAPTYRLFDLNRDYTAKFLLQNWNINEKTLKSISETPLPLDIKRALVLRWMNLTSQYQMAQEILNHESILILDEGFYHTLVNFFVHISFDLEYSNIASYIKNIPDIDILVHVHTSLDDCMRRLAHRKLPGVIRGARQDHVRFYLEKAQKAIEFAQDKITEKGTKIIKIENYSNPFSSNDIVGQLSKNLGELA